MKLTVAFEDRSYDISIEKGLLQNCGEWAAEIWSPRKVIIVSDENVSQIYGAIVQKQLKEKGFETYRITVEPGEKTKSLQTAEQLFAQFLDLGLTRKDGVIILGGGVVGDLVGFVASTYQRGVPFLQIPTTLLAQIDSSIGGKTAVNLPQGKNLVGTFYQPDGVLIDPETLNTLPVRHLREGLAEAIKYGAIADSALFEKLESLADETDFLHQPIPIISRCCEIKKEIVEQDERDTGLRFLLNFGHTIGHGIEQVAGYGKYNHGEAVAIGMNQMTRITEKRGSTPIGTAKRLEELIKKFHLPLTYASVNPEEIANVMTRDKKGQGGSLKMVQLEKIGQAELFSIDKSELLDFLLSAPQEGEL